jgi:hypothetical protein
MTRVVIEFSLTTVKSVPCITRVVIEFSLTTMGLASSMMANEVATLVVIECSLTTVVLASCITETG